MVAKTPKTRITNRGQFTPGENSPEVVAKWAQAVQLRTAGARLEDIARALGYANASSAAKAVKSGLAMTVRDGGADDLRELEAERLDRLQLSRWKKALDADLDSSDAALGLILKIMERRAKLLGLDAPQRHQVENNVSIVDRTQQLTMLRSEKALEIACDLEREIIAASHAGDDPGGIRPPGQ